MVSAFLRLLLLSCALAHVEPGCTDAGPVVLTPEALFRGTLNYGNSSMFARAHAKLASKKCLHVVAFGGSATVGAGNLGHDGLNRAGTTEAAAGLAHAFPAQLEALLNERYPCAPGHNVTNLGRSGMTTLYWVERAQMYYATRELSGVDMFIVETALNDMIDISHLSQRTEVLVQLLLSMNATDPAGIMYVALSSADEKLWESANPFGPGSDTALAHLVVTKPYGIPHMSLYDALGPWGTPERRHWWRTVYKYDDTHPTVLGHSLIAKQISDMFHSVIESLGANTACLFKPHKYQVPAPLFVSPDELAAFFGTPLLVDFEHLPANWLARAVGFELASDIPGKKPVGLLAHNVGAEATVLLPSDQWIPHIRAGLIDVMSLSSYNHMGSFILNASVVACDAWASQGGSGIGSLLVDSLWGDHVSEGSVDTIKLTPIWKNWNGETDWAHKSGALEPVGEEERRRREESCLALHFRVVESVPPREENKVKILSLLVY
jgi:hypothetical protein